MDLDLGEIHVILTTPSLDWLGGRSSLAPHAYWPQTLSAFTKNPKKEPHSMTSLSPSFGILCLLSSWKMSTFTGCVLDRLQPGIGQDGGREKGDFNSLREKSHLLLELRAKISSPVGEVLRHFRCNATERPRAKHSHASFSSSSAQRRGNRGEPATPEAAGAHEAADTTTNK